MIHTKEYVRRIAFVSDKHAGSRFSLWPPGIETSEGNEITLNAGQRRLHENWLDFCRVVNNFDCDSVYDLGDILHGNNRKEYGKLLMTPELDIQAEAAVELYKPLLAPHRKLYLISGSGYHGSLDFDHQKTICKELGGKYLGAVANIQLRGTKRIMNISHGASSAYIYRTTIMDREGLFQMAAATLGKIPKIDIVIRGHWHSFIHIHLAKQHMIQLPCWMALEPNKIYLRSYGKMQPDIGAVILLIDKEERITVWHYLYPLPNIADMVKIL